MSYATPARYIQRYGLAEAVQLLSDEQRLLTDALLKGAIAGAFTGTPTADEVAAAGDALERLTRQITVSSLFMDGYLRAAVTLPIAVSDANATTLEDCCLALVRCGLADDSDNATERMDECCKTWRVWLKDIAAGRVQLLAATGEPLAPSAARVHTGRTGSAYDWGRFGGVR